MQQITGYIHTSEEEAFLGTINIVKDVKFYPGHYVGYMELSNGETLQVKQHPCGNYNASIDKEANENVYL